MVRTLSLQCYCLWCPILSIWHHVSIYTPRIIAYVMVSYSITTAIVYGVSGSIFFFLIFLLVLIGLEPALRLVLILKEIYKRTHTAAIGSIQQRQLLVFSFQQNITNYAVILVQKNLRYGNNAKPWSQ